ncbi:MAG: 50S ribosomal protein L32e [Euryarchaeota archaeon]|nr:50S ribosomal protein L32e [Euryarchaeota archaeon]
MKFIRREVSRYRKLSKAWRRPRGVTNKVRKRLSGKGRAPSIGYGTDRSRRGLHPSGLREVLVSNVKELEAIDPATTAARISGRVGKRKKEQILKRADELKLKVLNR